MLLHSQHHFRRHNSRRSLLPLNLRCLSAVVFGFRTCSHCCWEIPQRKDHYTCHHHRKYCSNYVSANITEIVLRWSTCWWKPRSHRRPHTPSRAAQSFCIKAHAPHATSLALGWHHPWCHQCHVSPSLRQHPVICWCQCHVISADLWPLTEPLTFRWLFSRVDFCSPGSPYLVFHEDFIFAVCFCILCL